MNLGHLGNGVILRWMRLSGDRMLEHSATATSRNWCGMGAPCLLLGCLETPSNHSECRGRESQRRHAGICLTGTYRLNSSLRLQKSSKVATYPDVTLLILQLIFVMNIVIALYPLFRPKDDLSDIPLTPTQRSLLGLDPSVTPPVTPGTTYITPPKYRLSASRTASPASKTGSPLSRSASASGHRLSSGGSFSPSSSPLFHKAIANGGRDSGRRPSFGSSSLFDRSSPFRESSIGPATPSPMGGKRVSLGLSNKWLYERSRRLSASNASL